nr:hypothetical protein [Candidatus Bathyarchaeota archaeon]NIV43609.1 hypothetical protein [Candidatus Bathyarchaeota archaeon]
WDTIENPGFLSGSNDLLELDAFVTALLGMDPHSVGYLRAAAEALGGWSEESVAHGLESGIEIFARDSADSGDEHPALRKLLLKKRVPNHLM